MENDAEAVSPVKLASGRKTLNLSATVCLICGKYAKKGTLRNPTQQRTNFIYQCTNCERGVSKFPSRRFHGVH